jgi:aspartate/methionine/tyrosine aminotransferase
MIDIQLSTIKKIEKLKNEDSSIISLSQGSIQVGGIPQDIKNHIKQLLNTDQTDYYEDHWGNNFLRAELSKYLTKKFSTDIQKQQIIITHGCVGALTVIFNTILSPANNIVIVEPDYPAYRKIAQANHCNIIRVQKSFNATTNEWILDLDQVIKSVTSKTKIVVLSNPCNPLGIILPKKQLLTLASFCQQQEVYLVIDEAYRDFVFEGSFSSSINLVNTFDKVICCSSFSKSAGMSGWRVGYLVANKNITPFFAKVNDALFNCVGNIGQYAATYALQNQYITKELQNIVANNRDFAFNQLQKINDNKLYLITPPKAGFYFFIKLHNKKNTEELCMQLLQQAKVSIVPGNTFGKDYTSFIRICFAREQHILQEGINRFINFMINNYK